MHEPSPPADEPRSTERRAVGWIAGVALLLAAILIPFALFEGSVERLAASFVSQERPGWVAALAVAGLLAADVVLPVPSSLVGTASGALFGVAAGALLSWAGLMTGCLLAWLLGRAAGREGVRRLVGAEELARADRIAARYGAAAIAAMRPVPVLAEASVLLAGACGVPLGRFFGLCALANAGVALAYAAVGALAAGVSSFVLAFAGSIALTGAAMLAGRRLGRGGERA